MNYYKIWYIYIYNILIYIYTYKFIYIFKKYINLNKRVIILHVNIIINVIEHIKYNINKIPAYLIICKQSYGIKVDTENMYNKWLIYFADWTISLYE